MALFELQLLLSVLTGAVFFMACVVIGLILSGEFREAQ